MRAGAADVAAPVAVVVVEERDSGLATGVAVPQGGDVDDGVLQPLAAVHRHQLDGGGVGVEAAGALGRDLELVVGHLGAQPAEQADDAEALLHRDLVQRLADVAKVGEGALAADTGQHPRGEPVDDCALEHRGNAARAQHLGERADRVGQLVGALVPAGVELRGAEPEEGRQGGGPDPVGAVGLLERLEQAQPLGRGGRVEDRAPGIDHRRDADGGQGQLGGLQVGPLGGQHGDVSRLDRLALERRGGAQQPGDVVGQVGDHVVAPPRDRRLAARAGADLGSAGHAHPQCRTGADQPGLLVVRLDGVYDDPLVAEGRALEQHLHGVEQRLVGAPVDAQRLPGRRGLGGGQVGDDVAAAERVDRLLRVADQHHRGLPAEGAVEDLPLHRVGVLELVDQRDLPPVSHPGAGRGRVFGQHVGELAQQVVVAQHPQSALAARDLVEHVLGEAHPGGRHRVGRLGQHRQRFDVRPRVVDHSARDLDRLAARPHRGLRAGEPGEVEIVDDLARHLLEVLDQGRRRVGVAGDPQAAQHQLAELVDGRDRGRVERRERGREPLVLRGPLGGVGQQVVEQVALGAWRVGVGEGLLGLDELLAHPLAQLLAGGPGERHDQQLVERGHALGDVPGHEGRDRPRLAGAGAGLEQGGALRGQGRGDVEGVH